MLRISKLTDYAIVLSTHLSKEGGAVAVSDLASSTQIPQPTVSKVLKALTKAGVVASQRGAHGGYFLERRPEEVSVEEIITAIDGPIAVTECADESIGDVCEHEPRCGVRANWQRINQAVQSALSGITLADMVASEPIPLVSLHRSAVEAEQHRAHPGGETASPLSAAGG